MPEIALPTKAMQDTIKSGIDTLLAGRVVKSVQRGSTIITSGSGGGAQTVRNATILLSEIVPEKTIIFATHHLPAAGGQVNHDVSYNIKSTTTAEIKVLMPNPATAYSIQIEWQAIEFY